MSKFQVTTNKDSDNNVWYLEKAINSVDNTHDCLGSYEGIWGGKKI